jgi:trehalose 6-phosphate synthase
MRKTVAEHDVAAWAGSFLEDLGGTAITHEKNVKPARRS